MDSSTYYVYIPNGISIQFCMAQDRDHQTTLHRVIDSNRPHLSSNAMLPNKNDDKIRITNLKHGFE